MSLKMLPRRLPSSNHESEELEFSVRVWKGKYSLQDHDSEEDGGESASFSGAIHPPEPVDRDSMKKPNPNCLVKSLSVKGPFLDDLSIKELIKNPKNPDDISIKELVKNPRNPDEGFSMKKPNPNCLVKSLSVKGPFLDDLSIKELLKNPKNPDDISIKELVKNPRNPHEGFLEEASEETDECVWDASLPPSANASPHSSLDRNCESAKTSVSRASDSSGLSDDSNWTNLTSGGANKPHQGNDPIWKAIMAVRGRDGNLGMGHFRLLRRLGCGDIGSVYLSELSGTRCYFAMKVMDKESLLARKKLNRTQTEREILQLLDHPFLPTLYTHFETDRFSCLVMEFCPGGDLHTLRQRQPGKRFPEYAARFYAAEVLLALEYLHMLGVIYRDLKPENVLVREDGHIMLSDFDLSLQCTVSPTLIKGSSNSIPSSTFCAQPSCVSPSSVCIQPSCFFPRRNKNKTRKPKSEPRSQSGPLPELVAEPTQARSMSFVGTHEYLAPEIIKGEGHGSAVDWWTFGIFLHELLFGKTPFKGSGNRATLFNVVGQQLKIPDSPPTSFASRDLIRGLLVKEPQNRLGVKRGATEIKQHPFFEGVNWALIRSSTPPLIPRPVEIEAPVKAAAPVVVDQVGVGGGESKQQMVDTDMKAGGGKFLDFEFF